MKWEADFDICTFIPDQQNNIIRFTLKSSICTRIQETSFNILTCWYHYMIHKFAIHKFFPNTTNHCWRYQEERETMLHIFWSCPELDHYWREVWMIVQKLTDHVVLDDPTFFFSMFLTSQIKFTNYI